MSFSFQHYILDENKNIKEATIEEWAAFMETDKRFLYKSEIDGALISTVFLGISHGKDNNGDDLLYETMIFEKAELDQWQVRTANISQATAAHEEAETAVRRLSERESSQDK